MLCTQTLHQILHKVEGLMCHALQLERMADGGISSLSLAFNCDMVAVHTCGGHAGDVKALLPLLLDPLKGEGITHFVALLCVTGAFAHHHQ